MWRRWRVVGAGGDEEEEVLALFGGAWRGEEDRRTVRFTSEKRSAEEGDSATVRRIPPGATIGD